MKAKLIPIGNSLGVRIPKPIIEEVGLGEELELTVEKNAVVIRSARHTRQGWAEAAQEGAKNEPHELLMEEASGRYSSFDDEDWEW